MAPAPGTSLRVWLPRPRLNPAGRAPGPSPSLRVRSGSSSPALAPVVSAGGARALLEALQTCVPRAPRRICPRPTRMRARSSPAPRCLAPPGVRPGRRLSAAPRRAGWAQRLQGGAAGSRCEVPGQRFWVGAHPSGLPQPGGIQRRGAVLPAACCGSGWGPLGEKRRTRVGDGVLVPPLASCPALGNPLQLFPDCKCRSYVNVGFPGR